MRELPPNSLPIINEIVEKLACTRLLCYESNLIWAIIRKTYGWGKKSDRISGSQLSELTGILSQHCFRTLKSLIRKRIIVKYQDGTIGLNKRTKEWLTPEQVLPSEVLPSEVLPHEVTGTTSSGSQVLPHEVYTKDTSTKDTIQKTCVSDTRFQNCWGEYPAIGRRRSGQKKAYAEWKKLSEEEKEKVIPAIKIYKSSKDWKEKDGKFIKGFHLWLKDGNYNGVSEEDVEPVDYPAEMKRMGSFKFADKYGMELAAKYEKFSDD
jgi:phage replication O-like protein O